jgi:hypothetical protein
MTTLSEQVSAIEIQLTPEFQVKFKALKKRYRNIQADIKLIFEDLNHYKLQAGSRRG